MYKPLVDKLRKEAILSQKEYLTLIENRDSIREYLRENAVEVRKEIYGNDVYIRGLIEISNICKNDCYYCGIRASNTSASRFRLDKNDIMSSVISGYNLGFRTFVLQGGEDLYYSDDVLSDIIKSIKSLHPDSAVTLSLGERSEESYKRLKSAGADRYLLRHETSNKAHYQTLHPKKMSFDNRIKCLHILKNLGYQTGAGFMVGSPNQTLSDLASELLFLKELQPQMVGIGPFIPHHDTPFKNKKSGSAELTTFMLSLIRLTLPNVLLPATTALGTIENDGREQGILHGANVIMPNLSPVSTRKKYELYDGKLCTDEEAAENIKKLKESMEKIGYKITVSRGDFINKN